MDQNSDGRIGGGHVAANSIPIIGIFREVDAPLGSVSIVVEK